MFQVQPARFGPPKGRCEGAERIYFVMYFMFSVPTVVHIHLGPCLCHVCCWMICQIVGCHFDCLAVWLEVKSCWNFYTTLVECHAFLTFLSAMSLHCECGIKASMSSPSIHSILYCSGDRSSLMTWKYILCL